MGMPFINIDGQLQFRAAGKGGAYNVNNNAVSVSTDLTLTKTGSVATLSSSNTLGLASAVTSIVRVREDAIFPAVNDDGLGTCAYTLRNENMSSEGIRERTGIVCRMRLEVA